VVVRDFDLSRTRWSGPGFPKPAWRLRSDQAATRGEDMTAYLIVEHKITDPAKFEEYRTKVGPVIAKHGGRYLTKGGTHKVVETTHWQPDRVAIIEFPDKSALEGWYNSAEVQPLIALRRPSVDMDKDMLITIEGV
jgi:uncharacterized protein (DUF1330 family)